MRELNGVPHIFDRKVVLQRKERARRSGAKSFLAEEAARGIVDRLAAVRRRFETPMLVDTVDSAFDILKDYADNWTFATLGEREQLPLEHKHFDLVVSVLGLTAVNDLPGALVQIIRSLKPDGLFLTALFGGETLRELYDSFAAGEAQVTGGASPRVAPFADVRELGGLLQRAGFALPVADSERTVIRYKDFGTLVSDLRAAGETNALAQREKKPLRRDVLAASLAHYAEKHAEQDGRLRATFDIVYLTGWAPHESQQKPLQPGSARARLADALKTSEQKAGDTTPKRRG